MFAFFMKLIYPVLKFIGKIHMPWAVKKLKQDTVEDIIKVLEPGDILVTKVYGHATNLVIPGNFKHSAMYVGKGKIIESKDPAVALTGIYDFIMSKDEVCVCRPVMAFSFREHAAKLSHLYLGSPYDYNLYIPEDIRPKELNEEFFCSELCYVSLKNAWPCFGFSLREILGVPTIAPDDFVKASKYFYVVYKK